MVENLVYPPTGPINTKRMFEDDESSTTSVKMVSGTIGRCWKSPCKNNEIAALLEVTEGAVSRVLTEFLVDSNVITLGHLLSKKATPYNDINFEKLIYYLIDFTEIDSTKEEKKEISSLVIKNRKVVGDAFLEVFVREEEGALKEEGYKFKPFFTAVPEWLFFMILSYDEEGRKNNHYKQFLWNLYKQIIITFQKKYPIMGNSLFGLNNPLVQQWMEQKDKHRIYLSLSEDEIGSLSEDEIKSKVSDFATIFLKNKKYRELLSIIIDSYSGQQSLVILKSNEKTKKIETILIGAKARDFLEIFNFSCLEN